MYNYIHMLGARVIHISDSNTEVSRIRATEIVMSRLFPDAEISVKQWMLSDERRTSDEIVQAITENQARLQLLCTNILGAQLVIPRVQKLPHAPTTLISTCNTERKVRKIAETFNLNLGSIPVVHTSGDRSFVLEGKELRYSDRICRALSELGENHPFYVEPTAYATKRALENSEI